ncbi:MAG: T9SS type A sorting domain-containing protein [Bacteroides sp.]
MMRRKLQTVGWMAALFLSAVLWTTPAMAEEVKYELWIAGKQLTSENCQHIDSEHGFEGVTIAEGGQCRYDKEKKTLFMTGVTIAPGDNKSAIANYIPKLTINVAGENRWNTTNRAAIYNSGLESTIKGEEGKASLEVTSTDSAAVFVNYTLEVRDIDFIAKGKWGVLGKAPNDLGCNFSIRTAKGKITATSTEEGVSAIMNLWGLNDEDMLTVKPKGSKYYSGSNAFLEEENGKKVKEVEFDRKYLLYIGKYAQVDAANCKDLTKDPKFEAVKVGEEGHLRYDPKTKTLFMKDVIIKTDKSSLATTIDNAIKSNVDGLTIKIEGENSFEVRSEVISCNFPTHITGNGSLTLKSDEKSGINIEENTHCSNITVEISDITLSVETWEGFMWESATPSTKYILNNLKATVRGPFSNTDHEFKGCKIVSADGASPIEIDRIRVESVAFSTKEITRYVGDAPEAVPMPTVLPEEAGNKKLAWTSDNEEVAKVVDGQLIFGKKGTAHLTAAATDGSNQKAQLTVHVRYRVEGVKLYQGTEEVSAITVTEGAPFTLTAKVVPETTPSGVEWEFQAEEFTVTDKTTEKATFTALKTGDYTLTAKAVEDNTKTATVNVKVLLATPTAIAIAEAEKNFELKKDESKEITLNFTPAEHVNKEVNVTVAPKEALMASVTDGKLTIKADKPFDKDTQVTVTVTSKVAPSVSASCTVTLKYEKPGAVEDAALEGMVVAPNPFTSQLRISNPEGVEARYELVNTLGVVVRGGALQGVETVLNTENLNAGVYLLRLLSGTSSKTLRVVKE